MPCLFELTISLTYYYTTHLSLFRSNKNDHEPDSKWSWNISCNDHLTRNVVKKYLQTSMHLVLPMKNTPEVNGTI